MAVKLVSSTKIYLDARQLLDIILDIVPNFPRAYKFTIGSKMEDLAVEIIHDIAAVRRLNKANNERQAIHAISSINSYLGLLRFTDEYANRRKILNMIELHVFKEYVYIKGHYEVLALRNKHKLRYRTMQRIRNGDY